MQVGNQASIRVNMHVSVVENQTEEPVLGWLMSVAIRLYMDSW